MMYDEQKHIYDTQDPAQHRQRRLKFFRSTPRASQVGNNWGATNLTVLYNVAI